MEISGLISALVVGIIIGALGRLVVPGKQRIAIWLTILIGIVAALLGGWIAALIGLGFILTLVIQVVVAAGGVYLVAESGRRRR